MCIRDSYWYVRWQNDLRDLMGVERIGLRAIPEILGVALIVFLLLMVIGKAWSRAVGAVVRWLRGFVPPRMASVAGGAIAVGLTVALVNGVLVANVMRVLNLSLIHI